MMSNACFMPIELDEGWQFIETGIAKLKRIIEGQPEPRFIGEEYMMLYTTIFNMCNQKGPDDCSRQLYGKYKEVYNEYLNSVVLPSLREKNDEFMLRELVKRWKNHKLMVAWISHLFNYLDRYFIPRAYLPSLNEVGITCFRDTVYAELKGKVKTVVLALIDRDREGEQVDRALLKNVLDIFVEIGMGEMKYYVDDFEKDLLAETAAYYSQEASYMNAEGYSFPLYMCKGEECIRLDKERMARYIHSSTVPKILQVSVSTLEKKYSKKSRYEK